MQILLLLGDERMRWGDVDGAERAFAVGRRTCPEASRIWDLSAQMAERRGHLNDALEWARRSFKLRPTPDAAAFVSRLATKISESAIPN